MSPQLIALIAQLISLAMQYVPSLIQEGELAIGLLTSGKDPTPEQQATIDLALDKANAALQQAVSDSQVAQNPTSAAADPAAAS